MFQNYITFIITKYGYTENKLVKFFYVINGF